MKHVWCVARVCGLSEIISTPAPNQVCIKLTIEPSPFSSSVNLCVYIAPDLAENVKVGDRLRVDLRVASDADVATFMAATTRPACVGV